MDLDGGEWVSKEHGAIFSMSSQKKGVSSFMGLKNEVGFEKQCNLSALGKGRHS